MPKLKKSPYDEQTDIFRSTLFGAMGARFLNQADLAKMLRKSPSAVSRKLNDIDSISFGEMREIASHLGLVIKIEG
jgi:hypothetical protein